MEVSRSAPDVAQVQSSEGEARCRRPRRPRSVGKQCQKKLSVRAACADSLQLCALITHNYHARPREVRRERVCLCLWVVRQFAHMCLLCGAPVVYARWPPVSCNACQKSRGNTHARAAAARALRQLQPKLSAMLCRPVAVSRCQATRAPATERLSLRAPQHARARRNACAAAVVTEFSASATNFSATVGSGALLRSGRHCAQVMRGTHH